MAAMAANTAATIFGSCSFSIRNSTTTWDLQRLGTFRNLEPLEFSP
jgi:hypothetical protein